MQYLNRKIMAMVIALCAASFCMYTNASDQEVKITSDKAYTTVVHDGELVKVQRIQDTAHVIDGSFAKTSRPCPPFCVNPIALHEDVKTVAELEVIAFMEDLHYSGEGAIIDARTPGWHSRGTIPGSINIPFTVFEKPATAPELAEVLQSLGAKKREDVSTITRAIETLGFIDGEQKTGVWDFSQAKSLLLWCNGPWCAQSPRAIRGLLSVGYPPQKLYYYRGGMQMWQLLGLTTVKPKQNTVAAN